MKQDYTTTDVITPGQNLSRSDVNERLLHTPPNQKQFGVILSTHKSRTLSTFEKKTDTKLTI